MEKENYKKFNLIISDEEFKNRAEKIKKKMIEEKIDLLILAGDEFNQGYVRYVSDYRPILEQALVLISADKESLLLCGPECKTLAVHSSKIKNLKVCSDVAIPGEEYPNVEMYSFKEILEDIESKNKINRIGIADLNLIPNFLYKNILNVCGDKEIINSASIIDRLRGVKSKDEINIMRGTFSMALAGLNKGLESLSIGMAETDIAAEMSYTLYKMGAEQLSHTFLVASGLKTSPALNFPSVNKLVEDGDLVMLDIGAVYEGYYSDLGVTKIIGMKEKNKIKIRDTALKAKEAAIKKVRPGIMGKEIDLAAREITKAAGFEKNHLYGSCHGVGLQHCEYPFFGPKSETIVEEGMVFTIDIGLFDFDFGGVRQEDGIIVTSSGCEIFRIDSEKLTD